MPIEYVDYVLCTQMYHCAPSELDEQDWGRVRDHLICADVENTVREQKQKFSQAKIDAHKKPR